MAYRVALATVRRLRRSTLPGAIDSFLQLLGEEIAARENEGSALTS